MQIKPFRIEQFLGKYEFTVKYLLSSSDAESRTIQELLGRKNMPEAPRAT